MTSLLLAELLVFLHHDVAVFPRDHMPDGRIGFLVARGREEARGIRPDLSVFGQGEAQDLGAGRNRTLTKKRNPLDWRVVLVRPGSDLLVGIPEGVIVLGDPLAHAVIHRPLFIARSSWA